ncbi:unnamed protein product, partial [Allacma fusca]
MSKAWGRSLSHCSLV